MFSGVSKKGLGASLWVAQVSLEAENRRMGSPRNVEILKVGIALAGSVGVPGLESPQAVGQAGEHLKTRQNIGENLIFAIPFFKQLYRGIIDISCIYGTFLKSTI